MKYLPDTIHTDKRKRKWEIFIDECYYGMTCVRCLDCGRDFNSHMSFHFPTYKQAENFLELVLEAD